MSILNFENRTPRSMREMYDYMMDSRKTDDNGIFGLGVNVHRAVEEMEFVQKLYYRGYLMHPYIQVIFAFDVGVSLDVIGMRQVCKEIGECFLLDKRQVLGAIHYKNTEKKHCHYMINYIGMRGEIYRQEKTVIFYKNRVNKILGKYNLNPVYYYDYYAKGYDVSCKC